MPDKTQVELGQVQQTLFFPLLARARETESKRPLLNDPKAVELVREIGFDQATFRSLMRFIVVIRTMIFDWWIRQFLADHPNGTVVELGTGLNTRFERTDNGSVHWIDLDLPDTIELRRRFFADTAGSPARLPAFAPVCPPGTATCSRSPTRSSAEASR